MTDGMATLIVEVGFTSPSTGTYLHLGDRMRGRLGAATLAPSTLLVDVSAYVMSVDVRVGATRADGPTLRYEAGTCTIVLDNRDRRFDPANLGGPYVASGVTQVEPMRMVRVRATYNGQTWPLFRGFADNWQVAYEGPNMSRAVLTCSDAFMVFASYDRAAQTAVGAGEDAGARIGRILDSVSWPATDRIVDTGDTSLQSTTLEANVLSELLLTADSEMGELFMDARGRVVFRRRLAVQNDQRSAYPQAHFGDLVDDTVDTTVNLVSNPSLETGTTGWGAGGGAGAPTLSRSGTRAMFGSWSLLGTWATGGFFPNVSYPVSDLIEGRTYTFSVYVYVPSGSPVVDSIVAGTDQFGTSSSVFNAWERLTWTGAATSTSMEFQLWPRGTATAGQQVWVDGLQIEEGDTATVYCDGTQVGCEWDGPPHASASRRLPELPYADVDIAYDAQSIYNLFLISNAGGTQQMVERASSRTAYLTRSHSRSDLLLQTDASALTYGDVLLNRYASPELRFASMQLRPLRDPANLWPKVLGRQLGDRVRVTRRPPGGGDPIVRDVWVRGISHTITPGNWTTGWVFQSAPPIVRVVDTFTRTSNASNANPYFESTATPWTGLGGTVARSTAQAHEGVASLLLTPDGVSSVSEARAENVPATVGVSYRAAAWVRCAVSRDVRININWRSSGGGILSTTTSTVAVTAGTWTLLEVSATAPALTTQAQLTVSMTSTPPASNTLHIDEATLVEPAGWEITDSGHTWVIDSGTASDFSVDGSRGVISLGAVNSPRAMAVNLASGQDVTLWCTLPVIPTGAAINWGALLRRRDSNNYYWIDVQVGTDSSLTLRLLKREAGVTTQLTTAATGVTHSTTVPRILRCRAVGSKIEAKVWSSGDAEPGAWQLSTTDSTFRQDSAVGVIARLMTGNTNALPVSVGFNDFAATSQQVWT